MRNLLGWISMVVGIVMVFVWHQAWALGPVEEDDAKGLSEGMKRAEVALENLGTTFSGAVEVEAGYVDDSRQNGQSSDTTLATVELGVDVRPVKHLFGHLLFLFEEGDTDPVDVDEALIRLDGEDAMPLYLSAGRQYLPFGRFESHFISDPLTLELGETRETALVAGYVNNAIVIALGFFNGDVIETAEEDDHIDGYALSAVYTVPGGPHFGVTTGISYTSDIGESDNLQGADGIDVDGGNTIDAHVPGLAVFISANYKEKVFIEVEYVSAIDDFEAGELGFDNGRPAQPAAYNIELAYLPTERFEIGVRLGGAQDAGEFLPETLYGAVANYGLFDSLSLGLEYQYGEFDTADDKNISTVTAQLSVAF